MEHSSDKYLWKVGREGGGKGKEKEEGEKGK